MHRLHRFLRLAPADRAALVEAWGLYLVVELALRLASFTRLSALSRTQPRRRRAALGPPSISRLGWVVETAGRYAPVRPTCLKSALVLSWLLRQRGIATTLRIGVVRREGTLAAHAWLEHDGAVIHGFAGDEVYEPIFSTRVGTGSA